MTTELAVVDEAALAMLDEGFDDSAVQGSSSFTRVVAKNGKFRDADKDSKDTWDELNGYIVGFRYSTALWLGDDAKRPALSSYDGKTWDQWSVDDLAELQDPDAHTVPVADSKYTQWGSDPSGGKGKWAKDVVYLYLMVDGQDVPLELQLSAGSIKYYTAYKTTLSKQGLSAIKVRTKFTLDEAENAKGDIYSTWTLEMVNKIIEEPDPADTIGRVGAMMQATKTQLDAFKQRSVESQGKEEVPF
jgi:hypothetical protein